MTNKELQLKLAAYPDDMNVYVQDTDIGSLEPVSKIIEGHEHGGRSEQWKDRWFWCAKAEDGTHPKEDEDYDGVEVRAAICISF